MFEHFKATIRHEVEEFLATRKMQRAIELSQRTGQHFNHNEYPMFFTGALESQIVLVHLNPKQANNTAPTYAGPLWLENFDTYFTYRDIRQKPDSSESLVSAYCLLMRCTTSDYPTFG
jgi:hypothetical protein